MPWIVERKLKTGTFYYVRVSLHGHRSWRSAGQSYAAAVRMREDARKNIQDLEKGMPMSSSWTLADLAPMYLDRKERERPDSNIWRRQIMGQLLAVFGNHPLEKITVEILDRHVRARLDAGKSVSTVKSDAAVLRDALHCAFRWRSETGLSEYRLRDWKAPRNVNPREPAPLTGEEVVRVLNAVREAETGGSTHAQEGCLLIRLFLALGARPAELLAVRGQDLDPETLIVKLPGKKHGKKWRFLKLEKALFDRWKAMDRGDGGTLYPSSMQPAKNRYRDVWRKVRTSAQVVCRFYDLRHTFAAEVLARGASPRDLQYRLGHLSLRTTDKYAHFAADFEAPESLAW